MDFAGYWSHPPISQLAFDYVSWNNPRYDCLLLTSPCCNKAGDYCCTGLAERGSGPNAFEFSAVLGETLWETPPHVIAHEAISGVVGSLRSGIDKAPGFVEDFEDFTGCHPDYILFGYSQGSIVLSHLEKYLHQKNQLRGVVYIGNPQLGAEDPSIVGSPRISNGLIAGLAVVPPSLRPELAPVWRINYCMTDAFACDLTPHSAVAALRDEAGIHGDYFLIDYPNDGLVVDELAEWIVHG